ncbi:hypothetical protein B566_EDAN013747 [Ephemera danica]|nr:hypothetical protein B566_EDAN013747 [Ephemera danica]
MTETATTTTTTTMWISRVCLSLVLISSLQAAPPVGVEERVIIVEPRRPGDDLVSIVEAEPHRPEPLISVVDAEPAVENLPEDPLVSASEHDDSLVTVVEEEHNRQPLPDTSAITGELTEKLGVTNFFALWLVFNDPSEIDLQTGTEFSILAPRQPPPVDFAEAEPALVKRVLLDHVILGRRLHLASLTELEPFEVTSLSGRRVRFTHRDGSWYANEAKVLEPESEISVSGELVVLDSYVFNDYNSSASDENPKAPVETAETTEAAPGNIADQLNKLPALFNLTRVPVFNKFLKDANVSQMLQPDEQYTVLFPMDRAFQRWHPIDWGFYPFSVPDFTADVVRSHFLKGAIRFENIVDNQTATTITGRTVTFRRLSANEVTANGVPVMRRDVALHGGTVLVIPEVLFVDNKVVQQLRERNRDKETPPLLAYPWWNAQFLSHSYLALENDANFTSITRVLNAASNLHLKVPGKNYSFFVPLDDAFERAGITVPLWWSERGAGEILPPEMIATLERFVLRHIVPGRLYERELRSGMTLQSLDNSTHSLVRLENDKFAVDRKNIIERGDVFVYNLGTMFYIDGLLGSETEFTELREAVAFKRPKFSSSELGEEEGEGETGTDVLLEESATTVTPISTTTVKVEISTTAAPKVEVTTTVAPVTSTTAAPVVEASTAAAPVEQTSSSSPATATTTTTQPPVVEAHESHDISRNTESNDIPAAEAVKDAE